MYKKLIHIIIALIFSLLKIKDQKEYDFDPGNLVLNICKIYINLSQNENFTLAVSEDERSYSPELFKLAADVLGKIQFHPRWGHR